MSLASQDLAPREGLDCSLVKMGRTRTLVEPRRGPQAGKSGDPHSQNADRDHLMYVLHVDTRGDNGVLIIPKCKESS